MSEYKIQSHQDLRKEMAAVARGAMPAPADAGRASFHSADVLLRLLTPENRMLLKLIRDEHPRSVADLGRLSNRAGPNLLRTLGKLEHFGLIAMRNEGRKRVPVSLAHKISVEIDLFSSNDHVEVFQEGAKP